VSVGGVNAPLDASGALAGPMTGWGQQTGNGGSGGGCSETFPALSWESSLATPDPCIALGPHKRSQPDISLDADLNTGVAVVLDAPPGLGGRVIEPVGGTSVAAPEAAAMWALVLSACKATAGCGTGPGAYPYRLGNPNYYYYYLYQHKYSQVFYDVLYGANGLAYTPYGPTPGPTATPEPTYAPGYSAGPGLDLVTGIGVPYAKNLIQAVLAGPSPTPSP
jgi:kumamolisin